MPADSEKASTWLSSSLFAEIISKDSPSEIARHVCEQFRELTGARTVAYIQRCVNKDKCHAVYVSPPRRQQLFDEHFESRCPSPICPISINVPMPFSLSSSGIKDEEKAVFTDLEAENLLRCKISSRGEVVGMIVLINLMDEGQRGEIERMFSLIGPAIGLAIEKCEADYTIREQNKNLERLVEDRTKDLKAANLQLNRAHTATLNMMEDVVLSKKELESKNDELEAAMEELKIQKERAERASRAKSEFLSVMSHELRTPLNPVIGFTDILMETLDDPEALKCIQIINESGRHLNELISSLLDYTHIESGTYLSKPTPFDLRKLIRQCIHLTTENAKKRGLHLNYEVDDDVPESFITDELQLKQVITNLIQNAIKYSNEGVIDVLCKRREMELLISVSDQGIGISPAEQEHIFEPFYQVDSSDTRKVGGTGMGLSIVHKLVGALDGSISLDSTLGEGSCFTVALPIKSLPG